MTNSLYTGHTGWIWQKCVDFLQLCVHTITKAHWLTHWIIPQRASEKLNSWAHDALKIYTQCQGKPFHKGPVTGGWRRLIVVNKKLNKDFTGWVEQPLMKSIFGSLCPWKFNTKKQVTINQQILSRYHCYHHSALLAMNHQQALFATFLL